MVEITHDAKREEYRADVGEGTVLVSKDRELLKQQIEVLGTVAEGSSDGKGT